MVSNYEYFANNKPDMRNPHIGLYKYGCTLGCGLPFSARLLYALVYQGEVVNPEG